MTKKSKRIKAIETMADVSKNYSLADAVALLKKCPPTKFNQSLEIAIKLGIDPKKSDQQVRGTVSLPHGTGKSKRVLVFASGDKAKEAEQAGAEFVGGNELIEKVKGGFSDFDAVIATPDMMREVGKLGKVLGPKGLMPTPKGGTVTNDVSVAVKEIKAGKIEFKVDKNGVMSTAVGKLSFDEGSLVQNVQTLLNAIVRAKPASSKGQYIESFFLSSTMGPGLRIDLKEVPVL